MKDITQYFVDTVRSIDNMGVNTDGNTGQITEPEKATGAKRSRVKIKISRKSSEGRVCDIIESNNDMIDKTPSPFAKINNVGRNSHNETPKTSSTSRLVSQRELQSQKVDLPSSSLETSSNPNGKQSKRKGRGSLDDTREVKENVKKLRNKSSSLNFLDCNGEKESLAIQQIESNNEQGSQREESNAFQILMSRSKPVQGASPKKVSPQTEELNTRRSEEHKEKLKRSKEKLIALADKKGYSKRKIAEMEDEEKIEQTIQNRIKSFKIGEKKEDGMVAVVTSQRQSSGSLLKYFSKAPAELTQQDIAEMSTFVVKADVHVSENIVTHCKLKSSNGMNHGKPSRKSTISLSEMNDISVITSESTEVVHKSEDKYVKHHNKRRWSLRIQLNARESENTLQSDDNDEEIFSPRSKSKIREQCASKHQTTKSVDSEQADLTTKKKKGTRQQSSRMKLKLKKNEETDLENKQTEIVLPDSENLEGQSEYSCNNEAMNVNGKSKPTKTKRHKPPLIPCLDITGNNDTDFRDVRKNKSTNENCKDNGSKRKSHEKLAPLFTKRHKPDPEIVAARRLFLQPDITDTNNKTVDRKATVSGILPFPAISHVTQLNVSNFNFTNAFNIRTKNVSLYVPSLDVGNYKHVIDYTKTKTIQLGKITKPNVQEVLTEIEERCRDAKEMWNDISLIFKEQPGKKLSPKTRIKKPKTSEKNGYKNKENQTSNSTWTYKYKPMNTQQIVGNEDAARKLREWLNKWRVSVVNENSSGDEFYSSDCSYSNLNDNNQVAVLIGPHGSGKSASVYAVAEELDYTVLEVNASSKRTGKKLLKELEEATKSHRIRKDNGAITLFNSVASENVPKKIPKNSLILLEDIDLIFDEDEGFISATYQLVSNTKRPIVMTCRDVCSHLSKMAPQQNRIYFQNVFGSRASALLELISLAETGYKLPHGCVTELLQTGDLRKALLQLQYLLLSGLPQTTEQSLNLKYSLWQNMQHCLYKPAIKVSKKQRSKKSKSNVAKHSTIDLLNNVACKLDSVALVSSLIDVEDSALNLSHVRIQPSLSLTENTAEYSVSRGIREEIADWIGEKVLCKEQLSESGGNNRRNIELRKQLNKGVNLALSHTTSLLLDSRIISVDYLPSVRAICRAEENRANINNKRSNRFFHYLHGLKVPTTSLRPNILATACTVMQDKAENGACKENTDNV